MTVQPGTKAFSSADNGTKHGDLWIPFYFILFFLGIAGIDAVLVTIAVSTSPGVVAEGAYEKGLTFNRFLDQVEAQKKIAGIEKPVFRDGLLHWFLGGEDRKNIKVQARFYRPVADGHDFEMILMDQGAGFYEARPNFPLPGAWVARLEAEWITQHGEKQIYRTVLNLIAR